MTNKITLTASFDNQVSLMVEPGVASMVTKLIDGVPHEYEEGAVIMMFQNPNVGAAIALARIIKVMAPDTEVKYKLGSYTVQPETWYKLSGATGDEQNLP